MKLIIVCGNEDCRKEYETDTEERFWECPHCGRVRENDFYPFLSVKLMQARIRNDGSYWDEVHEESVRNAEVKVQEKDKRIRELEETLEVPDQDRHRDSLIEMKGIIEKDEAEGGPEGGRERAEDFIKKARRILIAQEERIDALEREWKASKKGKVDQDLGGPEASE